MSHSVSVIIVNYNTTVLMERCLASLRSNGDGISKEIIVVDNHSSDGGPMTITERHHGVAVIENERNVGFSKACNQGLRLATGDYVLFLNPDTTVQERTIEQCVTFMHANENVGLMGCKLLNVDGSLQPSCADFPYLRKLFLDHILRWKCFSDAIRANCLLRHWSHDRIRDVDWFLGAFMLARRPHIDRLKGFDEDYFLYGEDLDLCYRVKRAGWRVVFFPDAEVVHVGNPIWDHERKALVHKALLTFYRKHFSFWEYILLKSFSLGYRRRQIIHIENHSSPSQF